MNADAFDGEGGGGSFRGILDFRYQLAGQVLDENAAAAGEEIHMQNGLF